MLYLNLIDIAYCLMYLLLKTFLQYSRYPIAQINFTPPQFSLLCIFFCMIFAIVRILTTSIQCSLGFPILLFPSKYRPNIFFWILLLLIFFIFPTRLNRRSSITSIIFCWAFIMYPIFSFLMFLISLLPSARNPSLCLILYFFGV